MKTKKITLIICMTLLLIASAAQSASIYSDIWADICWSTLTVTTDPGLSIQYDSKTSGSYPYTDNSNGDYHETTDIRSGWVDTSASASITDALSNAVTDDSLITTTAYSSDPIDIWSYADSDAWREGYFSVTGSGYITFEVNYQLEIDLFTSATSHESYGYTEAWLYLENETTGIDDEGWDFLENTIYDVDSSMQGSSGTFTVSVYFNDGDFGYMEAATFSQAETTVPEPATIMLLSLGGLILRRKK